MWCDGGGGAGCGRGGGWWRWRAVVEWWQRVEMRGSGDRVHRVMGRLLELGRKSFPVAADGGRRLAGSGGGYWKRERMESEDISRNNILIIMFNKWEELAEELMR
ncbi:hypothetical protein Tco_0694586 [Tanacetum coccineum]